MRDLKPQIEQLQALLQRQQVQQPTRVTQQSTLQPRETVAADAPQSAPESAVLDTQPACMASADAQPPSTAPASPAPASPASVPSIPSRQALQQGSPQPDDRSSQDRVTAVAGASGGATQQQSQPRGQQQLSLPASAPAPDVILPVANTFQPLPTSQPDAAPDFSNVDPEVMEAARPLLTGNSVADRNIVRFYEARAAMLRRQKMLAANARS